MQGVAGRGDFLATRFSAAGGYTYPYPRRDSPRPLLRAGRLSSQGYRLSAHQSAYRRLCAAEDGGSAGEPTFWRGGV